MKPRSHTRLSFDYLRRFLGRCPQPGVITDSEAKRDPISEFKSRIATYKTSADGMLSSLEIAFDVIARRQMRAAKLILEHY